MQTFHSFFWSLLKTHGYLLGVPRSLSILLPQDEKALSGGINDDDEGWPVWCDERERLEARKLIERAKGVLMSQHRMSEPEAFRWIQRAAMDNRTSMRTVAGLVLTGEIAS